MLHGRALMIPSGVVFIKLRVTIEIPTTLKKSIVVYTILTLNKSICSIFNYKVLIDCILFFKNG